MKIFISNNQDDTQKIARDLAEEILAGKAMSRLNLDIGGEGAVVVALIGYLGGGKTTFARGFADGLGIEEKTKSPTFIIFRKSKIKNQKSKFKNLYHFDVYRIHDEKEILNLGWEEIISNPENIVLVEWADKIEKILPKNCVRINFKHLAGDKREIEII
ncbi:MAG: tRNA (adenosine(37)-N6)-threonylcarbamoyltransferase complex ATPase subunit type 1 TsaE [Candidatus Paceibacter sp.]|nr:tRNA (adenosine(37)-N6)-threonylcarbamoyltransferase complex ATPase subunit type 1 TsaE [Candidatus Paceibacter sp.]